MSVNTGPAKPTYPGVVDPPDYPILTDTSTTTSAFDISQYEAPYTEYGAQTEYIADDGVLQLPVAGGHGTACVFVQLHAPIMRKEVTFSGVRQGDVPVLPDPTAADPDEGVRGGFSIVTKAPLIKGDALNFTYQAMGMLTFYLSNVLVPEDGYRMGTMPLTTDVASSNVMTTADFSNNLL